MTRQLRTYILITGRDEHGRPVRRLLKYHVPLPGVTDNLEGLSNTRLRLTENALAAERARIDGALIDIHAEKYRRLEAVK